MAAQQQQYGSALPAQQQASSQALPAEQMSFPPPPPGPAPSQAQASYPTQAQPTYNPQDYAAQPPSSEQHLAPPPPRRNPNRYSAEQDVTSPIHYSRDPKKLVAYLVPFPKPHIANIAPEQIPQRFMIYTPPPPPFMDKPAEGHEKDEGKIHKAQRKWQDEIREAKTGNAKTMSWKGIKGKAIKGIDWGMGQTKSSNLEFLNRIGGGQQESAAKDAHADDGHPEEDTTAATVKLEEMLLVYPSSMPGSPEDLRKEFIETMLRSKTKAQRDSVIATGLLPVSFAIDVLMTLVWPFGGLLEIDAVWAAASIKGAKTSRSVTKRLSSTSSSGNHDDDKLHLNFTPSPRLAVLEQFLTSQCHKRDANLFPSAGMTPTETEVLEAIGWFPSSKGGSERNWEDEQWEISEVKDDLRSVMAKGAREWDKWCRLFEKDPQKAAKK